MINEKGRQYDTERFGEEIVKEMGDHGVIRAGG